MDLDEILNASETVADGRNDEVLVGLMRRLEAGVSRADVGKAVHQICSFSHSYRKLRKALKRSKETEYLVRYWRDCVSDGGRGRSSRWLSFYQDKVDRYKEAMLSDRACERCASCLIRAGASILAHMNREQAAMSVDLRNAVKELMGDTNGG